MGYLTELISGISPVFDFMLDLWAAFPIAFRVVVVLFFAVAVGFVMIRNLIL